MFIFRLTLRQISVSVSVSFISAPPQQKQKEIKEILRPKEMLRPTQNIWVLFKFCVKLSKARIYVLLEILMPIKKVLVDSSSIIFVRNKVISSLTDLFYLLTLLLT